MGSYYDIEDYIDNLEEEKKPGCPECGLDLKIICPICREELCKNKWCIIDHEIEKHSELWMG